MSFNPPGHDKTVWVAVRDSPIHGRGVFAARPIPAGARILEYTGEKITHRESLVRCQANNQCIFHLNEHFAIDGSAEGNMARFINHSCSPNCEAELVDGHLYITALRDLMAGEELCFNYGYDLVDYREHPCHCGSGNCAGFILAEAFFPGLRRKRGGD